MRHRLLRLAALLGAGAGLAGIYYAFDPARLPFPRCPFLLLTGLYCPGCGTQRAVHALLHGHLARAAGLNLLAVLSLPLLLLGAGQDLRAYLLGSPRPAGLLHRPWLAWSVAGGTLAFAVLRNVPGPLGTWLAP